MEKGSSLSPAPVSQKKYLQTELLHSSRTRLSWDKWSPKRSGTTAEVQCIKIKLNFATAAYKAIKPPEVLLYCLFPGKMDSGNWEKFRSSWGWTTPATQLSLILHDSPEIVCHTLLLIQVVQGTTHCWVTEQVSRLSLMDPLLVNPNCQKPLQKTLTLAGLCNSPCGKCSKFLTWIPWCFIRGVLVTVPE